jgi:hypothetical protein
MTAFIRQQFGPLSYVASLGVDEELGFN